MTTSHRSAATSLPCMLRSGLIAAAVASWAAFAGAETVCDPNPSSIPDGTGAAERTLTVPAPSSTSTITAVRLSIQCSHPWVGDLIVSLRHPSGTEVLLLDRPGIPSVGFPGPWGCGGDQLDVTFDDAAALDAETTCNATGVAIAGPRRPAAPLAAFTGLAPQGTWTVTVMDAVGGDAGTLASVCLEVVAAPSTVCAADIDHSGSVDGSSWSIPEGSCPDPN